MKQVISSDKSCKNAVAGVIVEQLNAGEKPVSSNTGPYCKEGNVYQKKLCMN